MPKGRPANLIGMFLSSLTIKADSSSEHKADSGQNTTLHVIRVVQLAIIGIWFQTWNYSHRETVACKQYNLPLQY